MAYVPARTRRAGSAFEIDVRGKRAHAAKSSREAPALRHEKEPTSMADETYPEDLLYHPEHDWARVDGEVATFGITWYAQDQLGEVVFFEPPEVGGRVSKDESYTEVESVKAVSDVYRAAVR